MKKIHIILIFVFALFISVGSLTLVTGENAKAQAERCVSGGGSWEYVGSSLSCVCPPSTVWSEDLGACRTQGNLCTDTGGSWGYNGGSTIRCVCPSTSVLTGGLWCRSNSNLCSDTGGEWGYVGGGSSLGCTCPSGSRLSGSRCIPTSTSSGSGSSSGSGGTPSTVDQPITTDCEPPEGESLSRTNCGIINLLVIGINVLSAIAGIVIVASMMIAGFQYMTAQDDPGKVQKAKSRIVMTLVALTLFIFMYALLNFLVPGGVL